MNIFHQLILLLVTLSGPKASPLRPKLHRPLQQATPTLERGTPTLERGVPSLKADNLEALQPEPVVVPHNSLGKMDSAEPRVRRAPPHGCQLGTCQLHNLANTLYRIGQTNGKDESKKANDPQGYGR